MSSSNDIDWAEKAQRIKEGQDRLYDEGDAELRRLAARAPNTEDSVVDCLNLDFERMQELAGLKDPPCKQRSPAEEQKKILHVEGRCLQDTSLLMLNGASLEPIPKDIFIGAFEPSGRSGSGLGTPDLPEMQMRITHWARLDALPSELRAQVFEYLRSQK